MDKVFFNSPFLSKMAANFTCFDANPIFMMLYYCTHSFKNLLFLVILVSNCLSKNYKESSFISFSYDIFSFQTLFHLSIPLHSLKPQQMCPDEPTKNQAQYMLFYYKENTDILIDFIVNNIKIICYFV